ncbi:hypothetical protein ACFO3E_16385 [Sphingobium tyrosinilyticum]|uniref:Secreted protein n=2 Tax=Sphingobium tyrosinilyticum TaxID=2715436 RepID=A0ABV9F6V2_9SPHN
MTDRTPMRFAGLFAGCALLAVATPAAARTYGFALSELTTAFYRGSEKVDCPEGRSPTTRDAFLLTQPPAERARLLKPEHAEELEKKYKIDYVFGPEGKDICTDADFFDTPDRPPQKLNKSKVAYGFDLDGATPGKTAPGTCSHDSFVSPSGEKGIDNQLFRVIGCNTFWRGAENAQHQPEHNWVENPTVVLVSGVDNWQDDPEVEVLIAPAADRLTLDVKQQITPGASLTLSDSGKGRTIMKGQIKGGLLTTDPRDLVIPYNWLGSTGGELILRHFRLRVTRTPEGLLKGEAGGYRPIDNAIAVPRIGGPGVANTAGLECASVRRALRLMADGDRDPQTGQCTSLSSSLNFAATPAFIFEKGVLLNSAEQ